MFPDDASMYLCLDNDDDARSEILYCDLEKIIAWATTFFSFLFLVLHQNVYGILDLWTIHFQSSEVEANGMPALSPERER